MVLYKQPWKRWLRMKNKYFQFRYNDYRECIENISTWVLNPKYLDMSK